MLPKILNLAIICCCFLTATNGIKTLTTKTSTLTLERVKNDGISVRLTRNNEQVLSAHVGLGIDFTEEKCSDFPKSCTFSSENLNFIAYPESEDNFTIVWNSESKVLNNIKNCFNLDQKNTNWYGGPEVWTQEWPIENMVLKNRPYISSKLDNGAVLAPYWLNSKGGYIFIQNENNLFVDQNHEKKDSVCFNVEVKSPYFYEGARSFTYNLVSKNNAKEAHQHAVEYHLGKPSGYPSKAMIKEPIWTTWAKYKIDIDDKTVLGFTKDIYDHNFTIGQIEIDDKWEVCYGDRTFDTINRFPDINNTVKKIHDLGYRVTLWTHPFVNTDCSVPATEGLKKGYFVDSLSGNKVTSWWNGNSSYVVDFTNPEAAKWFINQLKTVQEKHGIDNFKFDAGENDWLPTDPVLHSGKYSNEFTTKYVESCAEFGDLIEVRSAWRSQNLPIFVRMLDKNSVWGSDNGLVALVRSLIQFNMIGYTMVLPDMIGGNGYNNELPTAELLVRWTQANVFMPSLQFSYLPWELPSKDFDTTEIVRKFVDLHIKYTDKIIKAMENSVKYGTPVNPPIWWLDPNDPIALANNDEFLVGEDILAAPVLEQGAVSRDVYLPRGKWKDGNTGEVYEGNLTLTSYPAPIDVLPYFIKIN